jgi:hypothetical protein
LALQRDQQVLLLSQLLLASNDVLFNPPQLIVQMVFVEHGALVDCAWLENAKSS